jgi:hypothetical protein
LSAAWQRFWFAPSSAVNLGASRALFFGGLFLWYLRTDFGAWGDVSAVFWLPVWLFDRFHLPALPTALLYVLAALWKSALALSCVGLFTRASTTVAFVLGAYLIGLPQNFGKIHHHDAVVVLILGILAVSYCGDAVSLDARRRAGNLPTASAEYTWPVRAICIAVACVFLGAGVAKLRHAGLFWVTSDTLLHTMLMNHYHQASTDPLVTWGLALAQYPLLCRVLAAATMLVEVAYPLALFSSVARWLLVPAGVGLLIGFRLLLGPSFEPLAICHVFWLPWDRLWRLRR